MTASRVGSRYPMRIAIARLPWIGPRPSRPHAGETPALPSYRPGRTRARGPRLGAPLYRARGVLTALGRCAAMPPEVSHRCEMDALARADPVARACDLADAIADAADT